MAGLMRATGSGRGHARPARPGEGEEGMKEESHRDGWRPKASDPC